MSIHGPEKVQDVGGPEPGEPIAEPSESAIEHKLDVPDSEKVSFSLIEENTEVLTGFRRAAQNIKMFAKEFFNNIAEIPAKLKNLMVKLSPSKSDKTSSVAAEKLPAKNEPETHELTPSIEADELEMQVEEQMIEELENLIGDDVYVDEAVENLKDKLNADTTPEENALSIYEEINKLTNKLAQKDAIVAQGGADLSRALIRMVAKKLTEDSQSGQIADAVSKDIDEDKLFELASGDPLAKAKEAMQKELDRRVLNNEISNVKRFQDQINDYDAYDIVPNVIKMYLDFKKAIQ